MTDDPLDGWDDELTDWTDAACESGTCLQVQVTGDSVRLWESTQPGMYVVTTLASWQQWQDKARAEERARIAAWIRNRAARPTMTEDSHYALIRVAEKLQHGVLVSDDLAAGDE